MCQNISLLSHTAIRSTSYSLTKRGEMQEIVYSYLLLLFTAIGFSPGGSSPYTSTHNTNVFTR
jgi:hypothetical protein